LKIRSFQEKDAKECANIANEAFSEEISIGMSRFTADYFVKRASQTGVKLTVVEDGGIIGFMLMTDANVDFPAQLHLVAVKNQKRGKGVGTKLVKHAIEYTETNNWNKLKLSTRPWNKPMRKICTRLRFLEEGLLRKEYLKEDLIHYAYFPSET
jgi:RimJ/RimL family protein N-acetyltransferase